MGKLDEALRMNEFMMLKNHAHQERVEEARLEFRRMVQAKIHSVYGETPETDEEIREYLNSAEFDSQKNCYIYVEDALDRIVDGIQECIVECEEARVKLKANND